MQQTKVIERQDRRMKKAAPGSEFEAQITWYKESESRDGSPGDPLVNHAQQSVKAGMARSQSFCSA